MAMAATYTTFAGMVVHQRKNGVDTELISDPLGSVVKTKDAAGNETSRTEYWPYGEVQSSTGSNPTPFGFVGTLGYYRDLATRQYVRARYLRPDQGRWQTVDPLWPDESAYGYLNEPNLAGDYSGLQKGRSIPRSKPRYDTKQCNVTYCRRVNFFGNGDPFHVWICATRANGVFCSSSLYPSGQHYVSPMTGCDSKPSEGVTCDTFTVNCADAFVACKCIWLHYYDNYWTSGMCVNNVDLILDCMEKDPAYSKSLVW
jgi:RHS repeat-associated protein